MKKVVLVHGPGRVGTSTLAGMLSHLGPRVSRPHLPADDRTDQPSFETKWVADHHQSMLRREPVVRALDSRPEAAELAASLPGVDDAVALHQWFGNVLVDAPTGQVVVNDPRAFWFHDHWAAAAERHEVGLGFVVLVVEPVAFVRSRDVLRAPEDKDPRQRRRRDTAFLAGWVHAHLVIAEATRDHPRAYVRHTDLVAGWRPTLEALGERVGLELDLDAGATAVEELLTAAPEVDASDWDAVDVPEALRQVATRLREALDRLVDDPATAATTLDDDLAGLRGDYERVFDHALGLSFDHQQVRELQVSRRARARVDADYEAQIAQLEQQLEEAHSGPGDDEADDRR